jgi:hypothetical protein
MGKGPHDIVLCGKNRLQAHMYLTSPLKMYRELGAVAHACNLYYLGGRGKKITVQGQPQAKSRRPI